MTVAEIITAVGGLVTDYPIIVAAISVSVVFAGLGMLGRALKKVGR
jgi:hypothetical protein